MAIGAFSVGLKPPLVTRPMMRPARSAISVPSRAGALPSGNCGSPALVLCVSAPPEILRYVVMKGPIAVDGISLTVMAKDAGSFCVSLVQYTQEHTNLHAKHPGDRVNLETDIIARYVQEYLKESGIVAAEAQP